MLQQGKSVALSGGGNTALIGGDDGALVWTRSGDVWSRQGPKLVGSGAVGVGQGHSVALSADGNTALIGGPFDDFTRGAAWVWTRNNGVWTQQGQKLVGSGAEGVAGQGYSVALSADGNVAFVGGPFDNLLTGAVWVWTRNNGVWTQDGAKLVGAARTGGPEQGSSVAVSADGTTALVGGPSDHGGLGATWAWTRNGGVWSQQGPKLYGLSGPWGEAYQGQSVALSADGNVALIGGSGDGYDAGGAAWVWTRIGGAWTEHGVLVAEPMELAGEGSSVSLSGDGNTALIGGPFENYPRGAAWVWTRSGNNWTLSGRTLFGADYAGASFQGSSVSLSSDGHTALVGGPGDNSDVGAAWVFVPHDGAALLDFDGDGATDRTIFRPNSGLWYTAESSGGATLTSWGTVGDIDVPSDYDGDGKADVAVFRPSTGTWHIVQSSDAAVRVVFWGTSGDIPLAGDVDGDGKADLAIWRPNTGAWFVHKSSGGMITFGWGMTGDQPLLGDFDHDGKVDLTVYRPGSGLWYIAFAGGATSIVEWGSTGDIPVAGDFDGDGAADVSVFRSGTNQWFVRKSSGGTLVVTWGAPSDIPVSGDWDGDGKSDFTVWRPSTGVWYTQFAVGGATAVGWGVNGDKPIGRLPGGS